ncbi:MAG: glycosyltransferase [Salinibacter sp.]|uniref:glycosyltransferase n=1 Tax=Salinibacter sp. TaxID=2065818 RepID=UPI002FC2E897
MKLSVVIPVYNDPGGIDATLQSVVAQDHATYEVIPVDNNSTDETSAMIQEWAERHPDRIRPVAERGRQSSYAARNAGVRAADGEIVVFIDADMTAPTDWLRRVEEAFTATSIDYLGYEVETYVPDGNEGFWGWYDSVMGLPSRYHFEQKQFVPTACLAVRRAVFGRVGLFDDRARSGGDKEFGQRVHRHPDLTQGFRGDIVVYHPARTTFDAHRKKAVRVGRGLARLAEPLDADGRRVLLELLLHAVPPDPRRIRRRAPDCTSLQLLSLYVANMLLRYVRLGGAVSHFFRKDLA